MLCSRYANYERESARARASEISKYEIVVYRLTGIAGMALAKIVRGGGGSGLEASTVLTVVVGTRTGLRIQHSCRGCSFTVPPRKLRRALAFIIVYAVDASSTVLQRRRKLQINKRREGSRDIK